MADWTRPAFGEGMRNTINQSWNPKEFLKWTILPIPGVLSATPWYDLIVSPTPLRLEEQWVNSPLLSRVDTLAQNLTDSATTMVVTSVDLYRVRQVLKLVGVVDDEPVEEYFRVTSINRGTKTLTVTRAKYDDSETPAQYAFNKATTTIYILPPTRAEYETDLADNSMHVSALPTDIKYNYGMGFSVSETYTDIVEAYEANNQLRQDPRAVFESVRARLTSLVEQQSLIGKPFKSPVTNSDNSMGGLFHYISTNNTTDLTSNGGDGNLKWTHINDAVKNIVRNTGRPTFILCDIDTQQKMTERWSDARIMGMSGPQGTIGYSLNTIQTAIGGISLNFLAMDQIPPNTFVVCCPDKIQLGPVAGLGMKRLVKEPDGRDPNTYVTWTMYMNMRLVDSDKFFHKIKFTDINTEYM
jgi:hypothetical protein